MAEKTLKLKDAHDIVSHLEGERQGVEDEDFRLISEYLLTHRGFWPKEGDTKTSILQRGKKNINPAATLSLERAAGGLTTGMTPEGQPWFSLRLADSKLMEAEGVRDHLAERERVINHQLRKSGFYQAIHEFNIELLGFGGALLFDDTSEETISRYEDCTVGTYCIAMDSNNKLDTVTRRMRWSVKALKDKFGLTKLSDRAKRLLETKPYTKVDVVHVVRPREQRDDTKIDKLNMKYESIMYEDMVMAEDAQEVSRDILREGGYHEMPYDYTPYTRVGDSDYGMGPGHLVLWHSQQLNETERQKIIALQKLINPPMKKPASVKGRLNVGPAQETSVSATDSQGVAPLYEVPVQGYQSVLQEIQDVMLRIAAVTKADLFYDLPAEMRPKDMTLGEYMERKRERMQQIAPVVSLYEPSVLDSVIVRENNRADRLGLFPEPPPALVEAGEIEIVYTSMVAKSLRQVGAEATRVVLSDVKGIVDIQMAAGVKPTILNKVNLPQALDELAEGSGAPASIVNDDSVYEELTAQDEAAEAAEMQNQQAMEGADAMSKMGGVSTQGTVAGKIMEGQQGNA